MPRIPRSLRHRPEEPEFVANTGKLQYRLGWYQRALDTLILSADMYRAAGATVPAQSWIFVAMAHHGLHESNKARIAMDRARRILEEPSRTASGWDLKLLREAESLIAHQRGR